jgi:hypothetical protein
MNLVYSDQQITALHLITPSVFLAGPTPRDAETKSWRPEALQLFSNHPISKDISLFVPERSSREYKNNYYDQVEWEKRGLKYASVIMFWVPRKLDTMPAFTTNVEFGFYLASRPDEVLYGRPDDSEKNKYLDWLYTDVTKRSPINSLETLVSEVMNELIRKYKNNE